MNAWGQLRHAYQSLKARGLRPWGQLRHAPSVYYPLFNKYLLQLNSMVISFAVIARYWVLNSLISSSSYNYLIDEYVRCSPKILHTRICYHVVYEKGNLKALTEKITEIWILKGWLNQNPRVFSFIHSYICWFVCTEPLGLTNNDADLRLWYTHSSGPYLKMVYLFFFLRKNDSEDC